MVDEAVGGPAQAAGHSSKRRRRSSSRQPQGARFPPAPRRRADPRRGQPVQERTVLDSVSLEFAGPPVELFGNMEFPVVGDLPYFITLGPHGFYWFALELTNGPTSRAARSPLTATGAGALRCRLRRFEEYLPISGRTPMVRGRWRQIVGERGGHRAHPSGRRAARGADGPFRHRAGGARLRGPGCTPCPVRFAVQDWAEEIRWRPRRSSPICAPAARTG